MSEHAQLTASDIRGPYSQLLVNLAGKNGQVWLEALEKFLRKENPWASGVQESLVLDEQMEKVITREACRAVGGESSYARLVNCFRNDNCKTMSDVLRLTRAQVLRMPNMGRKGLGVLERVLEKHNLRLADED